MGVAAIAQAAAARRASGPRVVSHPLYLVGMALDVVGWGLSVLALRHLPLLVVQPILAASLAVTVALAGPILHARVSRRAWLAVVTICATCAVIAAGALPGRPSPPPHGFTAWMAVAATLTAIGAALAYRRPRTVPCALLAGAGYSGAAIAARAFETATLTALLADPLAWLLAGFAGIGAVMFARALETRQDAVTVATAWLWVVEIVVPTIVGLAVLGDRVRPGWLVGVLAAIAIAVGGTVVLSRATSEGQG